MNQALLMRLALVGGLTLFSAFAFSQIAGDQVRGVGQISQELTKPSVVGSPMEAAEDRFRAHMYDMSPEDAASGWIRLHRNDPGEDANRFPTGAYDPYFGQGAYRDLPPPSAWPIILDRLTQAQPAEKDHVAILYFDLLLRKDREAFDEIQVLAGRMHQNHQDFENARLGSIQLGLAIRQRDPKMLGIALTRICSMPQEFFGSCPDLVKLVGPAESRSILIHVLSTAEHPIRGFCGSETKNLARSLIIGGAVHLKKPEWSLWQGVKDRAFYDATVKQLGRASFEGDESAGPAAHYVSLHLGKAQMGKTINFIFNLPEACEPELATLSASDREILFPALMNALRSVGTYSGWRMTYDLAKSLDKEDLVVQAAETMLKNKKGGNLKADLALACSKWEAERGNEGAAISYALEAQPVAWEGAHRPIELAIATGNLSVLESGKIVRNQDSVGSLVDGLIELGDLAAARRVTVGLAADSKLGSMPDDSLPVRLAEIYYRAKRPKEVMDLLRSYPSWYYADLFGGLTNISNPLSYGTEPGPPLGLIAAWTFAQTDHQELAIQTLHDLLQLDPGQDEAYDLLNRVEGAPALKFYSLLTTIDPLASRPRAWEAALLLRLGRVSDAESIARKAVELDPTDGSAGRGHRLMAYQILAKVLRSANKPTEADIYERAVKAIRIAEDADRFRDIDLLPQAMKLYQQAAHIFADAYCVQARLAITLQKQGHTEEALKHLRKAYALMPKSFGEIDQLCLLCSGIVDDKTFQAVGLQEFESLKEQMAQSPQVFYFLGQQYAEQGDYDRALGAYEKATQLDDHYLNAWVAIASLDDMGVVPEEQARAAAEKVAEIDPFLLHSNQQPVTRLLDYKKLYERVHQTDVNLPPPPSGPLFALKQGSGSSSGSDPMMQSFREGPGQAIFSLWPFSEVASAQMFLDNSPGERRG